MSQLYKLITPILIIAFAVILRILPHPPNVAPITAMALFGGVYINKKYALIVPLIALFLSDLVLGFHDTMIFVYGSFLLTGLIGIWLKKHKSILNIVVGTFFSSLLFYLITNFGVWLVSKMYSPTIHGLLESYALAIPFYRNTLIGDFIYTGIFFIAYENIARFISFSKNAFYLRKIKNI